MVSFIKKSAVMNILVQIFEYIFGSFEYMFRSGIAGPSNNFMFKLLSFLFTVASPFYVPISNECKVPVFQRLGEHLLKFVAILVGMNAISVFLFSFP